jgi:nucleotide-binding universal stress UspA family protein
MKKILIAHDGSKSSEKALKKAFEIAEKFGSAVTVISVVPDLYLTELMEMDRIRILETLTDEAKRRWTGSDKSRGFKRRDDHKTGKSGGRGPGHGEKN